MIKGYAFHRGHFHLLVLENDAITYHECPASWFSQEPGPDNKTNVKLEWPPPFKPKPATTLSSLIDMGTGVDSINIIKG